MAETEQECPEVYPSALERGEVIECVKTGNHRKHLGHDTWVDKEGNDKTGDISWWGKKLTDEERAEADRIRALGGADPQKARDWEVKNALGLIASLSRP